MKKFISSLLAVSFTVGSLLSVQAQYSPSPGVANPDNPLDEAGMIHNEGVTVIGNALGWNRTNATPERLYSEVGVFLDRKGITKNFAQGYSQAKSDFDGVLQRGSTISDQWITDQGVSAKGLKYIHSVMDVIDNPSLNTVKDMADVLRKLEAVVKNDAQLPSKERDALLGTMAVARYSYDYWDQFYRTPRSGPKMIARKARTLATVKGVIKADAIGFLVGYIGGAIAGAATANPIGVLVGAAGGGNGCAIGNSLNTALANL